MSKISVSSLDNFDRFIASFNSLRTKIIYALYVEDIVDTQRKQDRKEPIGKGSFSFSQLSQLFDIDKEVLQEELTFLYKLNFISKVQNNNYHISNKGKKYIESSGIDKKDILEKYLVIC